MSYCRWGEGSNLYIFGTTVHGQDVIECCGCLLTDTVELDAYYANNAYDMLNHVFEHIKAGHRVPDYTLERLVVEAAEYLREEANSGR